MNTNKSEMYKLDDPELVIQQLGDVSNLVLFLDKLNKLFLRITNCLTLNGLFSEMNGILKQILHCDKISFLLKDEEIIKYYNEEDKGFGQSIFIDQHLFVIANPTSKFNLKSKIVREEKFAKNTEDNALFDPCFEDFETAFYGKAFKNKICHSVYISDKIRKSKM